MKERPAFRKYAKSFPMFIIKWPLRIGDKVYTLKDYPLLLLGNLAIIVAMFFLYDYSPFTLEFYRDEAIIGAVILGMILTAAYWLFCIYRFGQFNITWADRTAHPYPSAVEGYDSEGDLLPSKENKHAAMKSRGVFTAFIAGIAVVITAYCILGFGMAHIRILNDHKQDMEKLIEISNKYDKLNIHGYGTDVWADGLAVANGIGRDMAEDDRQELKQIFRNLRFEYVGGIYKNESLQMKGVDIMLDCHASSMQLVWYQETISPSQAAQDQQTSINNVEQLNEHWWRIQ